MKKKKRKTRTLTELMESLQQKTFVAVAWIMLLVIMVAGVFAWVNYPIAAQWGPEATMLFRVVMTLILIVVPCKFWGDMRRLNRLSESR